jgi:hypothetical protein
MLGEHQKLIAAVGARLRETEVKSETTLVSYF